MSITEEQDDQATFPMRVAARMTGVSPERMRAWEARHGAIQPARSEGGTRRYSYSDLDRLRLLRQAVDAGHRIGDVANLDLEQLQACLPSSEEGEVSQFDEVLRAIDALDVEATRRILRDELERMGPVDFGKDYVLALAHEIGERWERDEISIPAEHMATAMMRSMLLNQLDADAEGAEGPPIVFATPSDERHDLGLLVAALVAKQAEARPIFLGAEIPEKELVDCVRSSRAEVLALGFVTSSPARVEETLRSLRRSIPDSVEIWIGGAGIRGCAPVKGVERIENLEQLAAVALDAKQSGRARGHGEEPSPRAPERAG